MFPVNAPAYILVTGGSGFIGSWVIRRLLDRQYHVRAVVRNASKGEYLRKVFADHSSKFEFVVVSNFEVDGAFDKALEGIHAVQHIASPVGGNPDEVVNGAVNGTLTMLRSIAAYGKDVRRIILTSSVAALREPKQYPYVYTEDDWNLSAIKALENKDATPEQKYYASKILAEKAAWDFVGKMNIDLVTILPTLVIGPVFHEVQALEKLNFSSALFYSGILKEKPSGATFGNWVDVRDVADAHILAMEKEEASGQRLITSAGAASWQLICASNCLSQGDTFDDPADDTLHDAAPNLQNIPQGQRGNDDGMPQWSFSNAKIRDLGMEFLTFAQSTRETVVSMREHGW